MTDRTIYVGLDYHQDSVQVCVMDCSGKVLMNRSCQNSVEALGAGVRRWGARHVHAAVEACCGASDLADNLVEKLQWSVSLAHPGYVARIKQSPDKTDFNDAQLLADLLRVGYLPKVWLAPENVRELRRLVRYREQLVGQRRNRKLRVGALLREQRLRCPHAKAWTVAWQQWLLHQADLSDQSRWIIERHLRALKHLQADIHEVERRLDEVCRDDALVRKLLEQPGIGLVTAVTLRAEIGRFDRFVSGKQLSRFCGLSPRNASSGQRQADAGLIKAGRPHLRAVLMEAAHRLIRYERRWARLAARLRRAGQPGSVIVAAVANRWIRWLYHQVQPAAVAA